MINIKNKISLSDFTTIHLGGEAQYFCSCVSVEEIRETLQFAQTKNLRKHILGEGSNTIFSDEGFDGLIIKIDVKGISFFEKENVVYASVKAGEHWDTFVKLCVEHGYAGIECLSGIPGSVGATPIQNVGAYGQEVKDILESVKVLDCNALTERVFQNTECTFSYRTSRFKVQDAGKYIITEVVFRLLKNGRPTIKYPEVKKIIEATIPIHQLADGRESLEAVRNIVLSLRRKKSMVIDSNDIHSRSVGSFFLNPIVEKEKYFALNDTWKKENVGEIPKFDFENKFKISAAWLIENAGFKKGYKKNGVGISEHHSLALVNYGGTTKGLMTLAQEIQKDVQAKFGIQLSLEANVIR